MRNRFWGSGWRSFWQAAVQSAARNRQQRYQMEAQFPTARAIQAWEHRPAELIRHSLGDQFDGGRDLHARRRCASGELCLMRQVNPGLVVCHSRRWRSTERWTIARRSGVGTKVHHPR